MGLKDWVWSWTTVFSGYIATATTGIVYKNFALMFVTFILFTASLVASFKIVVYHEATLRAAPLTLSLVSGFFFTFWVLTGFQIGM